MYEKIGRTPEDILYELDGILPGDMEILPSKEESDGKPSILSWCPKFAEVSGKDLRRCKSQCDHQKDETVVSFTFTSEGGEDFMSYEQKYW